MLVDSIWFQSRILFLSTMTHFLYFVASYHIALNNTITNTLNCGQIKHINFPITDQGITIKLHSHTGKATLYVSSTISTPSEAFYDAIIETDQWRDIYLTPKDLRNTSASTVYITIVGDKYCTNNITNISVSATSGDESTGEPIIYVQLIHVHV